MELFFLVGSGSMFGWKATDMIDPTKNLQT
jgi:hypothetical protein